ncbi:MAG: hypothetical protein QM607_01930 [Microbacterium sp.]
MILPSRTAVLHRVMGPRGIPVAVLRLLLAVIPTVAAAVLLPTDSWMALAILPVIGAAFLHSRLSYAALAVIAIGVLISDPSAWRIAVAVLAVHAVHVLVTLCCAIPGHASISWRALRPTGIRFIVIQAIAQLVGLVASSLQRAEPRPALALVGALALVAVAVVLTVSNTAAGKKVRDTPMTPSYKNPDVTDRV